MYFLKIERPYFDVFTSSSKAQLLFLSHHFIVKVNSQLTIQSIVVHRHQADNANMSFSIDTLRFRRRHSFTIGISQAYEAESSDCAKRLAKEHWMRTHVVMHSSVALLNVWKRAQHHASWLCDRLFCRSSNVQVTMMLRNRHYSLNTSSLFKFETIGYCREIDLGESGCTMEAANREQKPKGSSCILLMHRC